MKPLRFRLRTIMLVIAVLAILMALTPLTQDFLPVRAGARVEGLNIAYWGEWDYDVLRPDGIYREEIYGRVPLVCIAILLAMFIAPLALGGYYLSRRSKRINLSPSADNVRTHGGSDKRQGQPSPRKMIDFPAS
jgi:hypothetical protein